MDKHRIDDQKIFYFPDRVSQWVKADMDWGKLKQIYPIYMEVSPTGVCNHRCIFCALDYLDYKKRYLDLNRYTDFVKVAAKKGVRSVMFGGEGEPMLHPKICEMVYETRKSGIDVAFTTNGSLMTPEFSENSLKHVSWIKISLDAGSPTTHSSVHRVQTNEFRRIIDNLKYAINLKREKKYSCSLGVQFLLLPQNYQEVIPFAKQAKRLGVDYFVVKPYSQGLYSKHKLKVTYRKKYDLEKQLDDLSNKKFSAVFRTQAFETSLKKELKYHYCSAVPFFWAYIMANGNVYSCSAFLENKKFYLGNINRESFDRIWEGEKRKKNWMHVRKQPVELCRENCRMDKVNIYLEKIKNPPTNYTFI